MKVKYDNGNESPVVNSTITLDTTPPTPILVVSPDSGITSETNFQFDPSQCSDNLAPLSDMKIRFDWENDDTWDTNWQPVQVISYTYAVGGGDKTVKMELQDGAGWTADTTVQIFVNTRPVAQFTFRTDPNNFKKIHFDASASTDYEDGTKLQYRWDFDNDGNYEIDWTIEDTVSYIFPTSNPYETKLEVRDQFHLANSKLDTIRFIPTDGLVAYYPFNGNANDESGNGHHGTVYGNATVNDFLIIGDNASDRVSIPSETVDGLNDFTFSASIKLNVIHKNGLYPSNCLISGARKYYDNRLNIDYNASEKAWILTIEHHMYIFESNTIVEDLKWGQVQFFL